MGRFGEQLQGIVDPRGLRRSAIADHVGQDHLVAGGHELRTVLAKVRSPRCPRPAAVAEDHHRAGPGRLQVNLLAARNRHESAIQDAAFTDFILCGFASAFFLSGVPLLFCVTSTTRCIYS